MKKIFIIFLCIFILNCKGTPEITNNVNISLKYPVILVHGIVFHDRSDILSFWGRIPKTLEDAGVIVYFGNTDAWGDYESNAVILKTTVDTVLAETKTEKVNIIAHSKGGLDSRYFIWKYNYGEKIASLTTVATPHRGAEIADLLYDQSVINNETTFNSLNYFGRLFGDVNPNFQNVLNNLTTANMRKFNEEVILDQNVYFQSIFVTMNSAGNDPYFASSYRYIKKVRGNNDGIVSEYSARWGSNVKKVSGRLSHNDIVDLKMISFWKISVPNIYLNIAADLSLKGF